MALDLKEYGREHQSLIPILARWRRETDPERETALEAEIETRIGRLFCLRREMMQALRPLPGPLREPLIRQYVYGQRPEELEEDG